MDILISKVREASNSEWDDIWKKCDYSTYFQSREWAEIWSKYTNKKTVPSAKIAKFTDGKIALLPFSSSLHYKGLVKVYISSPASTYGGWLSGDLLGGEHSDLLIKHFKEKFDKLIIKINPYNQLLSTVSFSNVVLDHTHVICLSESLDEIYKSMRSSHRSAIRKGEKMGVSVRKAHSIDDWKQYYAIYEDSLKRWGDEVTSHYSWLLFKDIYQRKSDNIMLWLAEMEDKIIAGALCFLATNHVAYWHGAALSEYFKYRPVNLLFWQVMQVYKRQGYNWFDFNPSGGHAGVEKFKSNFGAKPYQCPDVIFNKVRKREFVLQKLSKLLLK